ncbi:MAG: response regulator [Polyangiales bacterium]
MPASASTPPTAERWKQHPILIVDDEPEVLRTIRRILCFEGFQCAVAASGEEGLEVFSRTPAALVISDYAMDPGMNGTTFLTQIKALAPGVVTMILSAHSDADIVLDAVNSAGVYQYLRKPYSDTDLVLRVSQALQYYDAKREIAHMADAKRWMLRRMSHLENFSLMGAFGAFLHQRFSRMSAYWKAQMPALLEGSRAAGSEAMTQARRCHDDTQLFTAVLEQMGIIGRNYDLRQPREAYQKQSPVPLLEAKLQQAETAARDVRSEVAWDFSLQVEGDIPALWINPESFARAIHNLLENAIVYNRGAVPEDKIRRVTVRVGTRAAGAREERRGLRPSTPAPPVMEEATLWIEVHDTGPGMKAFQQGTLFQFFDTEADHDIAASGSTEELSPFQEGFNLSPYLHIGMGLPVALWCISSHDGDLRLLNPGRRGACFRIDIPLAQTELKHRLGLPE